MDRQGYRHRLTNTRTEPGRFNDFIILETDSPIRPTLQIPVYGLVTQPKKETP